MTNKPNDPSPARRPGEASVHWKGDDAGEMAGRVRARKLYPGALTCVRPNCGRPAERHHKDGNTLNNAPDNIEFLCRRHHKLADGRLAKMQAAAAVANTGRKHPPRSAEWKARLSKALTGRSLTEETKQKLRAANLGKKHGPPSDETRARISDAKKAAFARREKTK